ncbi:MAG: hypothetical protein N3A69_06595 [Leptospiraceae bacterium]|nr:hypothetical protein [Leptospiraceae bacterium]
MMIDKIKSLNSASSVNKTNSIKQTEELNTKDSIRISREAIEKASEVQLEADIQNITKITLSLPEETARRERLKEIKEKVALGYYDNPTPEMLSATADQLLANFFYPNQ